SPSRPPSTTCSPQPLSRKKSRTGSFTLGSLSFALPAEIPLAVVRFEVSADGQVRIEGKESASPAVEPSDDAVGPHGFEDVSARGAVAENLGLAQVLFSTDRAELRAVLLVMIQKFASGRKADLSSNAGRARLIFAGGRLLSRRLCRGGAVGLPAAGAEQR